MLRRIRTAGTIYRMVTCFENPKSAVGPVVDVSHVYRNLVWSAMRSLIGFSGVVPAGIVIISVSKTLLFPDV